MFKGSIPALVTPFSNGQVDTDSLEKLVEWHIAEGSNAIVAVGTTGESPTLSHDEHQSVIRSVVKRVAGRIPVIAGAGSNNTSESIDLVRFSEKIGADGVLIVTPYYNKPNQKGLHQHFERIHNNSNIPMIIYNIPGRSVIDMQTETMANLSKLPRIVGVKDATGDVGRVSDVRAACGKDFIQLSGNDDIALGFNAHGGQGCISVIANVAPRLSANFQAAMLGGNYNLALTYQDKLMPLHRAAFLEPNPTPIKYALKVLGKCGEDVRSPLATIEENTKKKIYSALEHAGLT